MSDPSYYLQISRNNQGAQQKTYFDKLGREVRKAATHSSGTVGQAYVVSDIVYDKFGRVAAQSAPQFNGLASGAGLKYWTRTNYDEYGRVKQVVQPREKGADIISNYSYTDFVTRITSAESFSKTKEADMLGRTVRSEDAKSGIVNYEYDALGNVKKTITNGQQIVLTYDQFNRKVAMDDPSMGHWDYRYNAFGELIWQQDAKAQITEFTYDTLGRQKTRTQPEGITTWIYDQGHKGLGKLTQEIGVDATRTFFYDNDGRPQRSIVSIEGTDYASTYAYNAYGQLSQTTHPNGFKENRDYDINGQLKRVSMPWEGINDIDLESVEQSLERTLSEVEELENKIADSYAQVDIYINQAEEIRNLAREARMQGQVSQQDLADFQNRYESAMANAESFLNQHDLHYETVQAFIRAYGGTVFKYVKTVAGVHYYQYQKCADRNWKGSCKKFHIFNQAITDRLLTRLNRLEHPPARLNFAQLFQQWVSFYDELYTSYKNDAVYSQAQMDALNRRIDELKALAVEHETHASAIVADQAEEIRDIDAMRDYLAEQEALIDALQGQMDDSDNFVIWSALSRSAQGRVDAAYYGNGYKEILDLDAATGNTLEQSTQRTATGELLRQNVLAFNNIGMLASQTDAVRDKSSTYTYDTRGQLTQWVYNYDTINMQHSYAYDERGNILSKSNAGSMQYDANTNRLIARTQNNQTYNYTYDANGNTTSAEGRNYVWNSFNKIRTLTQNGRSANFVYDGNNQLIKEVNGARTTWYLDNGYQITHDISDPTQLREEQKLSIADDTGIVAIHKRIKINGTTSVTEPDTTSFMHRNLQGSAEFITDMQGKVLMESDYTPYGEEIKVQQLNHAQWQRDDMDHFTGHDSIEGFGLINMQARLYDPLIGRFLTPDSIVPQPDNMLSYNLYVYVHNNPVNYVDPDGHIAVGVLYAIYAVGAALLTTSFTVDTQSATALNIVGTIMMAYASWATAPATAGGAASAGAVTGFTQSFIASGGNVGQGAKGAVLGGASAYITTGLSHGFTNGSTGILGVDANSVNITQGGFWAYVGVQALTQGVFSELQGGEFRDGAIGAVFSKIGSGLSGGQSINVQAAVTASFAYLGAKALGSGDDDAIMQAMGAAITVFLYNDQGKKSAQKRDHKLHLIASKNAPVGHVAIAGESPDGTVVARGFYPAEKSADVLTSDVAGVVRNDIRLYRAALAGKDGVAMQSLSVTQVQHDAALRFMKGFADSNRYNLYRCSCVTAVLQSLNAAGVSAFNTDVFGATPHAVYQAINLGMQVPRP